MAKILRLGITLTIVCVISAGLLSMVYLLTKPLIEINDKRTLELAKQEVLGGKEGKALVVAPRGYGGKIEMLVGVDSSGKVTGVKILNHTETPGLGANIVRPDFLKQFVGKSAGDPIEPKKDIDAITGATISSKAVCMGVKEALRKSKTPEAGKR